MEIYIHIPFCVKKCNYCDFFSGSFSREAQKEYVQTLLEEIEDTCFSGQVSSVFFGGGTPSLLPVYDMRRILEKLHSKFDVDKSAEISIECNPGTVNSEKLKAYKELGINRLSFGLQSTDNEILKKLGRIHSYETFLMSFGQAREAGFHNINVDLISGVPGVSRQSFLETLKKVVSLQPEHLSVYSLIIEEGTPFYELFNEKNGTERDSLLSDEEDRAITSDTNDYLEKAGFLHYEISNYARPGFECRHNIGYWTGEEYLGFGAAAASYVREKRLTDGGIGEDGILWVKDAKKSDLSAEDTGRKKSEYDIIARRFRNASSLHYLDLPYEETENLSWKDCEAEFFITGLRMMEGVSDEAFRKRFGHSFFTEYREVIEKHLKLGTVQKFGDRIFLTKYGIDVSNAVLCDFL